MATIRVRDWTKERIEEIREAESHSSHDSVIKALLKDRELAQFAGTASKPEEQQTSSELPYGGDKAFEDLTVLAEVTEVDNGIAFLWCPSCGNEIAHVGFEDSASLSVFEVECQRCLTRLDHRAIVAIEVGYPIEERAVEGTLEEDLQACVVDYWDRSLAALRDGEFDDTSVDERKLVWRYNEYLDEFGWAWPSDTPVIGITPGGTYRNETTGERIAVIAVEAENRGGLDDYRIVRTPADTDDGEEEILTADELVRLVLSRALSIEELPSETSERRQPTPE